MSWFSRQTQPVADKRAINAWERLYEELFPLLSKLNEDFPKAFRENFGDFEEFLNGNPSKGIPAQKISVRGDINYVVVNEMKRRLDSFSLSILRTFRQIETLWWNVEDSLAGKKESIYMYLDNYQDLKTRMRAILNIKWEVFAIIEGGLWADTRQRETLPQDRYVMLSGLFLNLPGYRNKILRMSDKSWIEGLTQEWQVLAGKEKDEKGPKIEGKLKESTIPVVAILNAKRRR